jgi:hypothetical protein
VDVASFVWGWDYRATARQPVVDPWRACTPPTIAFLPSPTPSPVQPSPSHTNADLYLQVLREMHSRRRTAADVSNATAVAPLATAGAAAGASSPLKGPAGKEHQADVEAGMEGAWQRAPLSTCHDPCLSILMLVVTPLPHVAFTEMKTVDLDAVPVQVVAEGATSDPQPHVATPYRVMSVPGDKVCVGKSAARGPRGNCVVVRWWLPSSVSLALAHAHTPLALVQVLHFVKQSTKSCIGGCCGTRSFNAVWTPAASFREILVSGMMVKVGFVTLPSAMRQRFPFLHLLSAALGDLPMLCLCRTTFPTRWKARWSHSARPSVCRRRGVAMAQHSRTR